MLSPFRKGKITGSRIGSVLGCKGAFSSRNAVLKEMVAEYLGKEQERYFSGDMARGVRLEPLIIEKLIQDGKAIKEAGFLPHQKYDFLGATPDGYYLENGKIISLEIKAPRQFKEVSESYIAQMQLEMEVLNAEKCLFVQGVELSDGSLELKEQFIERDREFIPSNLEKLKAFMQDFKESILSCDDDFLRAEAKRIKDLQEQEKQIKAEIDKSKELLCQKYGEINNDFISISLKTRSGGYDYKRFLSDKALDIPLDYKKADSSYFAVAIKG